VKIPSKSARRTWVRRQRGGVLDLFGIGLEARRSEREDQEFALAGTDAPDQKSIAEP
jgi:hypothetical protein